MKREVKFKVWDKDNNYWFQTIYEAYRGRLQEVLIGLGGDITLRRMVAGEVVFEHERIYPNRFVKVQYTGLKDKNGKGNDIYDGDIFMFPRVKEDDEYLGTVNFDNDLGCFIVHESNGGWEYLHIFIGNNKTAFIGGNIFENPELQTS